MTGAGGVLEAVGVAAAAVGLVWIVVGIRAWLGRRARRALAAWGARLAAGNARPVVPADVAALTGELAAARAALEDLKVAAARLPALEADVRALRGDLEAMAGALEAVTGMVGELAARLRAGAAIARTFH